MPAIEHSDRPSIVRRSNVFILSDTRSGSTLLDQCLGAHPDVVSLGEVHWLRAYVHEDRTIYDPVHPLVCSCGMTVNKCPFWTAVRQLLGRPLESLSLQQKYGSRLGRRNPGLFDWRLARLALGGRRLARDAAALFDAVSAVTGCSVCVDSSKSAVRFRAAHDRDPARTLAIFLARDYRAVVYSKMKRGASLEAAAIGWKRKMCQIELLTAGMPDAVVLRLRYEDLCREPRRELDMICGFLGIPFAEVMLRRPSRDSHHIGGSPSKFDDSKADIVFDDSYLSRFGANELARMREIVGETAARWGY